MDRLARPRGVPRWVYGFSRSPPRLPPNEVRTKPRQVLALKWKTTVITGIKQPDHDRTYRVVTGAAVGD